MKSIKIDYVLNTYVKTQCPFKFQFNVFNVHSTRLPKNVVVAHKLLIPYCLEYYQESNAVSLNLMKNSIKTKLPRRNFLMNVHVVFMFTIPPILGHLTVTLGHQTVTQRSLLGQLQFLHRPPYAYICLRVAPLTQRPEISVFCCFSVEKHRCVALLLPCIYRIHDIPMWSDNRLSYIQTVQ